MISVCRDRGECEDFNYNGFRSVRTQTEEKHRSNVQNGYYGEWGSNDLSAYPHEVGHFLGLADKYSDVYGDEPIPGSGRWVRQSNNAVIEFFRYPVIGAKNFEGVEPNDIMGDASGTPKQKVVTSELKAIGDHILSLKKASGVMQIRDPKLDDVPPMQKLNQDPPPIRMDPKQMAEIH